MKVKKIGIVSLSSGIMGEDFVKHELDIGLKRLKEYGIEVEFLPNALKGMKFIKDHPECRAKDLLTAFNDDSIDMILCAIGGEDTYRLLPYLFENDELKKVARACLRNTLQNVKNVRYSYKTEEVLYDGTTTK